MRRTVVIVILLILFLMALNLSQAQNNDTRAAPSNDHFAGAMDIGPNQTIDVTNFNEASNEAGEPIHVCGSQGPITGGRSVWFRLTLTEYSRVYIKTEGTSFTYDDFSTDDDTIMTMRQGTAVNNLSAMICHDDQNKANGQLWSYLQQALFPGVYYIQVSSWDNSPMLEPSTVRLSISSTVLPTPTATPTNTPTNTPDPLNPTEEPGTPTPTLGPGIELLTNTSFETIAVRKQPQGWNSIKFSKDRIKCDKPTIQFSRDGSCAYSFKGSANELSKLAQLANTTDYNFVEGDRLLLSVYYRTNAATPRLKMKLRVFYDNPAFGIGKQNMTINVPSTEYVYRSMPIYTMLGNAEKIKVQFQNRAAIGKIFIDDVSLLFEIPAAR